MVYIDHAFCVLMSGSTPEVLYLWCVFFNLQGVVHMFNIFYFEYQNICKSNIYFATSGCRIH